MNSLRFEWDPNKAIRNLARHGVSFEEARTVFGDPLAITIYDETHSRLGEDRWITTGLSERKRHLVVVSRDLEDGIRILTARQATKRQIKDYEEGSGNRRS
jgi:uncharacterized DUF497 family protein